MNNFRMLAHDLMQDRRAEILIVDDTPTNLELLVGIIKNIGYRLKVALNGEMALRVARIRPPNLIVMNVCLPGMNGYDVCRCFKSNTTLCNIPVIFVSAVGSDEEKTKAFECGGVDYFAKPFSLQEVQACIERLSRLQRNTEKKQKQLEMLVEKQLKWLSISESSTIFALAKLAESRDVVNMSGHLERVGKICRILTEKLFEKDIFKEIVTVRFIETIFHTAPLHDIGKIAIPDAVLLKPGTLTGVEFEMVKTHTVLGAQALRTVFQFYPSELLEMAVAIARFHHEKWDGSGYPDGLIGEKIPLCARITGLVDVYDAIRSRRCYKNAMSHETACKYICENSGKHFDPQLVKVFLQLKDEFQKIYYNV